MEFPAARQSLNLSQTDVTPAAGGWQPRPEFPRYLPILCFSPIEGGARLDEDIIARYKATGPGWQTRINEDLKAKAPRSKGRAA